MTTGSAKRSRVSGKELEAKAAKQIAQGDKKIERLVKYLARTNKHNITNSTTLVYNEDTGLFSTPLGVVGQTNIDEARKVLDKLSGYVIKGRLDDKRAVKVLDKYLTLIPQSTGMNRPTLRLLMPDSQALRKQNDILDSLQASLDFITTPKDDDKKKDKPEEKIWDVHLEQLTDKKEIKRINDFYRKSAKSMHACYGLKAQKPLCGLRSEQCTTPSLQMAPR